MKILMTQRALVRRGGTEMITVEVGRKLSALGHEVAVYCPCPGELTKLLKPSGIHVKTALGDIPFEPDVIHGHHHLTAMAALAHFPRTPAIYCWHGVRPWVEQPPPHRRIWRYVVMSQRMVPQLQVELGLPVERIALVPNFVDVRRFSRVRTLPEMPRRALLYGHGGFSDEELARLERVCAMSGLSFEKIGYPYGNPNPAPEVFLPEYDIVFAIGRCAIEAMACGCAVIPVVPGLAGSLVTQGTMGEWACTNFSPRHGTSANQIEEGWFAEQLAAYTPAGQMLVTAAIRDVHSLDRAVDALLGLYREAVEVPPEGDGADEFAPYLARVSPQADEIWSDLHELRKLESQEGQLRVALDEAQGRLARSDQERADFSCEIGLMDGQLSGFDQLVKGLVDMIAGTQADGPSDEMVDAIARLIRSSGAFDMSWYLAAYPDVAEAGMDPVTHYILFGAKEGRAPSAFVRSTFGGEDGEVVA